MNHLFASTLMLSLAGSLFILALFLLKPVICNQFGKSWQYYIWLVVILRFLLPFSFGVNPFGSVVGTMLGTIVERIEPEGTSNAQEQAPIAALPRANTENASNGILAPSENAYSQAGSGNSNDNSNITQSHTVAQTPSILQKLGEAFSLLLSNVCLIWLVVALGLLLRKITIYQSFIRYIKAGREEVSDIEHLELFGRILVQKKVKRGVELYTNHLISSPLLIGFFKPCIVLPSIEISEVDFRNTIAHELTHYKRLDMFYKWLVQLTICLHWFNPLVYVMGREINRACELSCDEAVILKLNAQEQKSYGNTLLNALAMGNYNQSLASLALNEGKVFIKERLDFIMNFKKKSTLARVAMLLLTFAFLCGFSVTGTYAASTQKQVKGEENINISGDIKNSADTIISTDIINSTDTMISADTEKHVFSLINQFSYVGGGYENAETFVLEKDTTIKISTKMSIEEGELNLSIQPIGDGSFFSNGYAEGKVNKVSYQVNCAKGEKVEESKTIDLKAGTYSVSLKCSGKGRNAEWAMIGTTGQNFDSKASNSTEIIQTRDIDAFALELIETTNCWDTIENFLPYMTSTGVENVVAAVRKNLNVSIYPGYEEVLRNAAKYFGKGTKTASDSPLTRNDVDELAVYMIDRSANWSYVKPLFPYMTKNGVEQLVTIFLQRTGNYEIASEAEAYLGKSISSIQGIQSIPGIPGIPGKQGGFTGNTGGINFERLPSMTTQEVDTLAKDYINNTGEFGYVYNLRQFMSIKGIDEAVALYVRKTGDYGLVGAMLQFMSKDARHTLVEQYFESGTSGDYDWIYTPYK